MLLSIVGSVTQQKQGYFCWIHSGLSVDGNLVIGTSSPAKGDVLMSLDNLGTVGWTSITTRDIPNAVISFDRTSSSIGLTPASGNYQWTVPAGVTSIKLRAWGGGGLGAAASAGAGNVSAGGGVVEAAWKGSSL